LYSFVIVSQYYPPEVGASQARLSALVRQLSRLGHEVEVVTALPHHLRGRIHDHYQGRFYVRDRWEGIPVYRTWVYASPNVTVGARILNYTSFALTCLYSLARLRRPTYTFVESPPLMLFPAAWLFAKRWGVPIILNVADLWPASVKLLGVMQDGPSLRLAEHLESWAYAHATYINAVTEGIYDELAIRRGYASKVLFLPNGVDTERFSPRKPDHELIHRYGLHGKKVVLYAGTHGLAYRLDMLVDVAALTQDVDAVLMLVGEGHTKPRVMQAAAKAGVRNMIFVEAQPESEMPRYFTTAYATIIPLARNPLFEGTRPAKIFPSLATGTPIIYSGEGEGARLVSEANAGIVVPPESPSAMAEAIRNLIEQPALHAELARNARQCALESFSWETIIARWLRELESRECDIPNRHNQRN
jgi:colanic acid biosynthesis glycosyl transferase WcaI